MDKKYKLDGVIKDHYTYAGRRFHVNSMQNVDFEWLISKGCNRVKTLPPPKAKKADSAK